MGRAIQVSDEVDKKLKKYFKHQKFQLLETALKWFNIIRRKLLRRSVFFAVASPNKNYNDNENMEKWRYFGSHGKS